MTGELSTDEAVCSAAASDFGNRLRRRPLAVLRPAEPADVAAIVRYGRRIGVPVVPRGAGHSVDGQALARDGIVIDLSALDEVAAPTHDQLTVSAGTRWSAVVDVALRSGLVPPVLPDYLGLTVGGTLAAGGIGGTTHRYGSVADNVLELQVVTPDGELVGCSPQRRATVFDAVRGSQAEHGIITRARLALVSADPVLRCYRFEYPDLDSFLADQLRLARYDRIDHVLGQIRPAGARDWSYLLEIAVGGRPVPAAPPDRVLPDDLSLLDGLALANHLAEGRSTVHAVTLPVRQFLYRMAALEQQLRATGSWQHDPHPRRNLLLPGRHARALITEAIADMTHADLGPDGAMLCYAFPSARIAAPNVSRALDPITVLFGVQRTAPRGDAVTLQRMLRNNQQLLDTAIRFGGTAYSAATRFHQSSATGGR